MLLDLDQGSLSMWKNGAEFGILRAEGLTGPLSWAVVLADEGDSAKIEAAPAPPSPTAENLELAKEWLDLPDE
eukprot:SAG31_NODE_4428_length_3241_cov_1.408020_1_plen_73_part_00